MFVAALVLGQIGDLPILPPGPGPGPGPPPALSDGFPEVGDARFVDSGEGRPEDLWGGIACARRDRVELAKQGGAAGPRPDDQPVAPGFRRLRVLDGDDSSGERCELGLNDHFSSPVALYREGEHLVTFASLKLSSGFPLSRPAWQVIMQMKQSQPADRGGGIPVLALHAYDGRWRLVSRDRELWSGPATANSWTRFALDVKYSPDPDSGSVQLSADLNGDGDALDGGEKSRKLGLATLKVEGAGSSEDGLEQGAAIPSHLRAGLYHNPVYRCARYRCSVGIDDVAVYEAR